VGVVPGRDGLKNDLNLITVKKRLEAIKENTVQIKERDGAIERLRDMKARLSTKMVGAAPGQLRNRGSTTASSAPFSRHGNNDARTGSKGDYIFATPDESGHRNRLHHV
jgi:hypothetical protein